MLFCAFHVSEWSAKLLFVTYNYLLALVGGLNLYRICTFATVTNKKSFFTIYTQIINTNMQVFVNNFFSVQFNIPKKEKLHKHNLSYQPIFVANDNSPVAWIKTVVCIHSSYCWVLRLYDIFVFGYLFTCLSIKCTRGLTMEMLCMTMVRWEFFVFSHKKPWTTYVIEGYSTQRQFLVLILLVKPEAKAMLKSKKHNVLFS